MSFKQMIRLAALVAAMVVPFAANTQQGKWAATDDPTAKSLIDMERQWAEEACTHSVIVQTILADDFQGTSPDAKRYSKAEAVESEKNPKTEARECRLNDAKVHFLGDNMALVYGSESSIRKASDGKEYTRSTVMTLLT